MGTKRVGRPALQRIVVDNAEGRLTSGPAILIGAIAIAVAATVWLWADYSAAVFFETVRAGFVACFG